MSDDEDMDYYFDLPGGDEFDNVTELFLEAARDMGPDEVLLTEDFTLLDAMSAFEIGEPRMDSGMIPEQHRSSPPFDPLAPMLPQEICWIMDRSFTCEMEWHAGNTLSQTVYTLLYVHCLPDLNPDFLPRHMRGAVDSLRPPELVTIVLRAAVFGLLKSCDLSWRELSKGRVFDNEDWQSEKCEVSLLEHVNVDQILERLEAACDWLHRSSLPDTDIESLCDRIELRMLIIRLLKPDFTLQLTARRALIAAARERLQRIQAQKIEPPHPNSPASQTFDPHITRRIPNFMPIRVVELPAQEGTWGAVNGLLSGWEELCDLLESTSVFTWEIAGTISAWSPKRLHKSLTRAFIQSAIFDASLVFGRHPTSWALDRFFIETLSIPYDKILQAMGASSSESIPPSMKDIERRLLKLVVYHIRTHWANPPRRRRYLMRSILEWQEVYNAMHELTSQLTPPDQELHDVLASFPKAALVWRLAATREVVLSGFQQELYMHDERSVAYWYLARILDTHLCFIDELLSPAPEDSRAHDELRFQAQLLTALQMMAIAMCALTFKQVTPPFRRMSLNFSRRYKWAFRSEFDGLPLAEPVPDLISFTTQVPQMLQDGYSPSQSLKLAEDILRTLSSDCAATGYAGKWAGERHEFVRGLADVCQRLEKTPASSAELRDFDTSTLKWDPTVHPWFPDIRAY